jgi:hypothetical protein
MDSIERMKSALAGKNEPVEEGVSSDGSAIIVLKLDAEWKKSQKALVVAVTKGLSAVNAWAKQQGLKFKKAANLFGGEFIDQDGNFYVAYPKMLKDGAAEGGRVVWAEDDGREPANLGEAKLPGSGTVMVRLDSDWGSSGKVTVVARGKDIHDMIRAVKKEGLVPKMVAGRPSGWWEDENGSLYTTLDTFNRRELRGLGVGKSAVSRNVGLTGKPPQFDPVPEEDGFIAPMKKVAGKFPLGRTVMTAGVNAEIQDTPALGAWVAQCLQRHANGDWGDLNKGDAAQNDRALIADAKGEFDRVVSEYRKGKVTIMIITEADRSVTTVLFPDEY